MNVQSSQVMDVQSSQKDTLPEGFVGRRTATISDSDWPETEEALFF